MSGSTNEPLAIGDYAILDEAIARQVSPAQGDFSANRRVDRVPHQFRGPVRPSLEVSLRRVESHASRTWCSSIPAATPVLCSPKRPRSYVDLDRRFFNIRHTLVIH